MRLAYDDAFDGACAEAAKEREQRQRKASTQRPDDAQPTVSDILSKLSTPPAVEPNAATQRSPTPPGNLWSTPPAVEPDVAAQRSPTPPGNLSSTPPAVKPDAAAHR